MSTAERTVNIIRLRQLLLGESTRSYGAKVQGVYTELFDSLLGCDCGLDKIVALMYRAFNSLPVEDLVADPRIVADILKAPAIIYSVNGVNSAIELISRLGQIRTARIGEGIAIGLLELCVEETGVERINMENAVIKAFTENEDMLTAFAQSRISSTGSGRMSHAIKSFAGSHVWMDTPDCIRKRSLIFLMFKKWQQVTKTSLPFVVPSIKDAEFRDTVIEYLAVELMTKMLIGLSIESKFRIFASIAEGL